MEENTNKLNTISISQQCLGMKLNFPNFECFEEKAKATWLGTIKPSQISETYKIKILYELNYRPKVHILEPLLRRRNGLPIPHILSSSEPCLLYEKYLDWTPAMNISTTILPMLSIWLNNYEAWFATGRWSGGGV